MQGYIGRSLEPVIAKAAAEFPVVVLTGPRQSGKTTLLKYLFRRRYRYASLDTPDMQAAAVEDPRGFLEAHAPPVIFDEMQHCPQLLPYIKQKIDANRGCKGQYLLTGSQNLALARGVTESLAGRAAMLQLLPLSRREAESRPLLPLPWEAGRSSIAAGSCMFGKLWESFLRGGYPELSAQPERDANLWHAAYMQTYLERDVRMLRQVGDLAQYRLFLQLLAARSGQLLNLTDAARDLGIAVNTVKAWIGILEATYQIIVLRPYFASAGKRLVKRPKVYFMDVGALCHLAGLKDAGHAAAGPMGGAIMETAMIAEVFKALAHRGLMPQLYFWRTTAGSEVDLLVDVGGQLVPLEAKLSATPRPEMAKAIRAFRASLPAQTHPGYVVHPGDSRLPLGGGVSALPFADL